MATIGEITQKYIQHRDTADVKAVLAPDPLMNLLMKNMAYVPVLEAETRAKRAIADEQDMNPGPLVWMNKDVQTAQVTPKMSGRGYGEWQRQVSSNEIINLDRIYAVMHAAAPVELVSEGERQAVKERDALTALVKPSDSGYSAEWHLRGIIRERDEAKSLLRDATERNLTLRASFDRVETERDEARAALNVRGQVLRETYEERDRWKDAADKLSTAYDDAMDGIIELNGEIAALRDSLMKASDSSSPDYHGPVADGRATPDISHERFHESVKDVLSGKIMPKAREQMADALKRAPTHEPTTASTSKPMNPKAMGGYHDAYGIRAFPNT